MTSLLHVLAILSGSSVVVLVTGAAMYDLWRRGERGES
jgi:hypothetical protein